MQRRMIYGAVTAAALVLAPAAVAQPDHRAGDHPQEAALSLGLQVAEKSAGKPLGPNPWLALLPDPAEADYAGWAKVMEQEAEAQQRAMASSKAAAARNGPTWERSDEPIVVIEEEAADARGENDTIDTAQVIEDFGTERRETNVAQISGSLAEPAAGEVEEIAPGVEDDGSIPLATDSGVGTVREAATTTATIGDGPHGSSGTGSGDLDFYSVTLEAGESLTAAVDTPDSALDPMVFLWDDAGELVAFDDDGGPGFDSLLSYTAAAGGTYYVMATGYSAVPDDPFDSGSGDGAGSEGQFDLTLSVGFLDVDVYAVELEDGDVLGTVLSGGAEMVGVLDPSGDLVMGSQQDASALYPAESPLPGGGNAVADHVADETGWHYVMVSAGTGDYDLVIEAYRPGLEKNRPRQVLFLDFDGARINTGIFGGPGVRDLSPFEDYVANWGLSEDDYDDLVDTIIETVEENLDEDLDDSDVNRRFDIRIRNSRDHRDPWGSDNVSRIIIGGSIEESGIATIGIAESIDPGNYGTEESALVLLDVLSEPAGPDASLNTYITEESDVIEFVGTAVGNVTAHEAGHFFGNWHVDQFNDVLNLMDQGGNFPLLYGVGDDGVGGTADDPDIDFHEDTFNPSEGFTGTEDTLTRLAMVLTR